MFFRFSKVVVMASIISPLLFGAERNEQKLPKPDWLVQYQEGTDAPPSGTQLRITIANQGTFQELDNLTLSIPIAQLAAIYFDQKIRARSAAVQAMPRSGCHYAELQYQQVMTRLTDQHFPIIIAVPANPRLATRIAERLLSPKPIGLFWNDGATQKSAVLKFNECEYATFISILETITGPDWTRLKRAWGTGQ